MIGPSKPDRSTTPSNTAGTEAWTDRVRDLYTADQARLWRALVAWSSSPDVADEAVADAYAQLLRRGINGRRPHQAV